MKLGRINLRLSPFLENGVKLQAQRAGTTPEDWVRVVIYNALLHSERSQREYERFQKRRDDEA